MKHLNRSVPTTFSALCLLAALGCDQSAPLEPQLLPEDPFAPAAPVELERTTGLEIGPIEGLTTAWHSLNGRRRFAVPRNATFELRFTAPMDASIRWNGAIETRTGDGVSYAVCPTNVVGSMPVSAEVRTADGLESSFVECAIVVVAQETSAIATTSLALDWDPGAREGTLTNTESMDLFFNEGRVADVSMVGLDHYLTSVGRQLRIRTQTEPAEFGHLTEVRVDGRAVALGIDIGHVLANPGAHRIDVGPPNRSQSIRVDAYAVSITSHRSDEDLILPGQDITFQARTEPPGFESRVRWVASTKYGTAVPSTGRGEEFTTRFDNVFGPGESPWMGVAADNARGNFDLPAVCNLVGEFEDCNGNGVDDPCESDCNINGIADALEIIVGLTDDCNGNFIPDECESDCDGDGTPDSCEPDADQDGIPNDCECVSSPIPIPPGPHTFYSDFNGVESIAFPWAGINPPTVPLLASSNGVQPGGWTAQRSTNDDPSEESCVHAIGDPQLWTQDGRLVLEGQHGNFSSGVVASHPVATAGVTWTLEALFYPGPQETASVGGRGQFGISDGVTGEFVVGVSQGELQLNADTQNTATVGVLLPCNAYRLRVENTVAGATAFLFDDGGTLLGTATALAAPALQSIDFASSNYIAQARSLEWIVVDEP